MKSYICKCCGAEIIADENTNFTSCLYCGNNIAIVNKEYDNLNMKKMIPFSLDKEEAKKIFEKLLKSEIVSMKRIFVPIRFCNFEFDYLLYYEYKEEHTDSDGDTHTSYYDAESLVDGTVTDEIIFGTGKIKDITLKGGLQKADRVNYDPVLLKDASIEYSTFEEDNNFIKNLEYDVKYYAKGKIRRDITRVYSENYFVSSVDLEPFSTLVPVYVIKTSNGRLYNLAGASIKEVYSYLKKKQTRKIITCIGLLLLFIMLFITTQSVMMAIPIVVDLIILIAIIVNPNISEKKNYNYDYKLYNYGDKRNKVKY